MLSASFVTKLFLAVLAPKIYMQMTKAATTRGLSNCAKDTVRGLSHEKANCVAVTENKFGSKAKTRQGARSKT